MNLKIILFGISFKFQNGPKTNKGGRCHRRFRYLFFRKPIINLPLIVSYIGYDSMRSGFFFLGVYFNGIVSCDLAPIGLNLDQIIIHGDPKNLSIGSRLNLKLIPVGTLIYNIELRPGNGGKLMKAAGMYGVIIAKHLHENYAIIRFRSGIRIKLSLFCCASIGRVSNIQSISVFRALAGYSRRMGRRPKTRGIAKNPVDHPNGGRTSGGKVFRNKTGRVIKNVKTVLNNVQSNKYIQPIFI